MFENRQTFIDAGEKLAERLCYIGLECSLKFANDVNETAYLEIKTYQNHIEKISLVTVYTLFVSNIYNNPVLYFTPYITDNNTNSTHIASIGDINKYLVPKEYLKSLSKIGIQGGISQDYHPLFDVPSYFIHSCSANEVLDPLLKCVNSDKDVFNAFYFLYGWLNTYGKVAGLDIPLDLVVE